MYDADKFGGRVSKFGFFDHNPAPLKTIRACVEDMKTYLDADPANVVAVHCKAGKGRTGLMIAAFLVYTDAAASTVEALNFFGLKRTSNGKGVTIPSQMRYVDPYARHAICLVMYLLCSCHGVCAFTSARTRASLQLRALL